MATAGFFSIFIFISGEVKTFIPKLFAFTKFFAGQKISPVKWRCAPPINKNVKNG
jgi:hypothetical protein